ncbi:MAG: class I SAM-dependent rRNA methyltransferase [Planctomycetes bacterium]|nr:class I SAM-dependent rRNA methyltransferase [Planctomycetota bacterium]
MNPAPEQAPLPRVALTTDRAPSHPWLFRKTVERPNERIAPGTVVDVHDKNGLWVARGFYNAHARVTLRVLTTKQDEAIDDAFFARKLAAAVSFRRDALKLDAVTNAYRLVHSEADGLSGLVVDRFGDTIVVEFFAAGMFKQRGAIMDALRTHYPAARFYYFAEEHVGKQESFDCRAPEPPPPVVITEHGLKFRVAPGSKHKTGFFVDQRDNRKTLSEFCAGKRVLDLCCNSGGFGVYAKAMGGADEVVGLDLDEQAIDMAKQNAKLNNAQIRYVQADLFAWLRDVIPNGERFDTVVLDPAKLTRDREDVESALRKYCDMNRLALLAVKPGGTFLTCSCTGLVSEADFLESVRRAAWQAGRTLQVFKITGAAPDHPFLIHVQEGRYLKAVFCKVD